jgi:hypothetical protein
VDGLVRGVVIPSAGQHEVVFQYRPLSFTFGSAVAGLIAVLLAAVGVYARLARRRALPGWALVLGAVLVLALVGSAAQTYWGSAFNTALRAFSATGVGMPEAIDDRFDQDVFYTRSLSEPKPETSISTWSGETVVLTRGDLVLDGSTGRLWRMTSGRSSVPVIGQSNRRVRVAGIGPWSIDQQAFTGLDAVYANDRWSIDTSGLGPVNPNNRLQLGPPEGSQNVPGFFVSPIDSRFTVTQMKDADGPFVRIQATAASPYLVLNTKEGLPTEDQPIALRGQIRAHSSGEMRLTLYDVVDEDGQADTSTDRAPASEDRWTTLELPSARVRFADPNDNYSLGLFDVQPGDWFDVRELSLFLGRLP